MKNIVHFNSIQSIPRVETPVLKRASGEPRKRVVVIAPAAASWATKVH